MVNHVKLLEKCLACHEQWVNVTYYHMPGTLTINTCESGAHLNGSWGGAPGSALLVLAFSFPPAAPAQILREEGVAALPFAQLLAPRMPDKGTLGIGLLLTSVRTRAIFSRSHSCQMSGSCLLSPWSILFPKVSHCFQTSSPDSAEGEASSCRRGCP